MAKVHLQISGTAVACGAETSWRRRMKAQELDLSRVSGTSGVTCLRCRATWNFQQLTREERTDG